MDKGKVIEEHRAILEKSDYYRNALGRFVGRDVIIDCSDFRLTDRGNDEMLMVLRQPTVIKIVGVSNVKPFVLDHIWIRIPESNVSEVRGHISIARKIRVTGTVREYCYKDTELLQVGLVADEVCVLKYKKEIAKKFHLNPGDKLSEKQLDMLRIEENRIRIRSALAIEQMELRRIAIAACLHKEVYGESGKNKAEQTDN